MRFAQLKKVLGWVYKGSPQQQLLFPWIPNCHRRQAETCAHGDRCQVGGFLRFSGCETLAQLCLLYSLCHLLPDQRFSITLKSLSDNTAAEANSFSIYHQIHVVRFCGTIVYVDFCSSCRTWCQPHRGAFQWPCWQNFPPASRFASIRTHPLPLSEIWFPFHTPTAFTKGSKVACKLPVSRFWPFFLSVSPSFRQFQRGLIGRSWSPWFDSLIWNVPSIQLISDVKLSHLNWQWKTGKGLSWFQRTDSCTCRRVQMFWVCECLDVLFRFSLFPSFGCVLLLVLVFMFFVFIYIYLVSLYVSELLASSNL